MEKFINRRMDNKTELASGLLCMACLCVGRYTHEITDEKLKKYYIDILNEIPLNKMVVVPVVCWECDAMLRKVLSFREQVKDCYRILQTYVETIPGDCLLRDVCRSPRLNVHINDPVTITPTDTDSKVKLENYEDKGPEDIQTVLCEVKRDRRLKKSVTKNRTKPRLTRSKKTNETDPVALNDESETKLIEIKIECKDDSNVLNKSKRNLDLNITKRPDNSEEPAVFKRSIGSKTKNNIKLSDTFKTAPFDTEKLNEKEIKMEDSNEETNMIDDSSLKSIDSNVDVSDIDDEIKSFLDDVKKNTEKTMKTRRKKKTVKSDRKSQNVITVELSYDEMQAERSRHARRESFVRARYKCESCLLVFNCASSLQAHDTKKHKTPGDLICSICQTIISSVDAFTAHYKRHMRRYECATCHKRTADVKAMHQHVYTKHDISLKKYKCNTCGKVSNSIDKHRYHCDTHKARVECPQCDKTFSHRAGLMNHRLAVHESQNEFPCSMCDKVFRWKTSLKRHLEKHDTESKSSNSSSKAYCESCGIGFSSVCSLQRHLRNSLKHVTHDQLKFICDHCNQRFADKTKLRDHIEEKHLHRSFHCHICHKPSKNRVGLEQHVRAVHKGRPNNRMCHHCGKGFPTKVQLESHIRTHTGERPFMCEYCPSTFSQQSNLYKHHRQVHLNMKTKRYSLCKKRTVDGNQTGDPQPTFQLPIIQYMPENGFGL